MKNLYALLFAMAITLAANSQVLDGSSCSQAKEIPSIPDSCAVNEHQLNASDYEQWHHVKPAQSEMHFKIEPPQTQPEAHIHKLLFIKGGCGGGTVVEKKDISLGQTLEITRTDLTVNDDYYIKIERDPSCAQCSAQGGAFYGLCVERQPAPGSACASAVSLTTSNTCNPTDFTMSGNEMWFSFVADSANIQVMVKNDIGSAGKVNKLTVYENSCSSQNAIADTTYAGLPDSIMLFVSGLVAGNTYHVKAEKNGSGNVDGEVCLLNSSSGQYPNKFSIVEQCSPLVVPCGIFQNVCGLDYCQVSQRLNQRVSPQLGKGSQQPCTLTVNCIPQNATILQAFVWFTVVGNAGTINMALTNPNGVIKSYSTASTTFNNIYIAGNGLGFTNLSATCWTANNIITESRTTAYRVNILSAVTGNGNYIIDGLPDSPPAADTDGATLFIVYSVPCDAAGIPATLILYDGLDIDGGLYNTANYGSFTSYANNINERGFFIVGDVEGGVNNETSYSINGSVSQNIIANFWNFVEVQNINIPSNDNHLEYSINSPGPDCFAVSVFGVYFQDGDAAYCGPTAHAGSDKVRCSNEAIASFTIGGSPTATGGMTPYTYSWAPAAGLTCTNCANPIASPTVTTTYTVTVTDANGCTAVDAVTITEATAPDIPLFSGFSNNICDNEAPTYNVMSPVTGYTYCWSVTQGAITTPACSTAATVNWSGITAPGTITLTVTDNNGCQSSATQTIFPCCRIPSSISAIDFYLNNINCASTQTYTNKNIVINGTYAICSGATVTFMGCKVFLGPDAKIDIGPNAAFVCTTSTTAPADQTILKAGCDYMWDGIFLATSTSTLTITSVVKTNPTTIMDAKNAVVTKSGNSYSITKSVFNNNLKGIIQQNTATSATVTGNDFKSADGALLPYYTGNTLNNATRAISFIELTDVGGINIGAAGVTNLNLFDNADNGIFCIRSTVNIVNNKFQNFKQPAPQFNAGNAIFALQNVSITVGGSAALKNNFIDCDAGVRGLFEQSMAVKDNKFLRVENGVFQSGLFSTGANKTVSILANELINYRYGITVEQMPRCTLSINNNVLKQTNSIWKDGAGITVDHKLTLSKTFVPQEIVGNTLTGGFGSYTDIKGTLLNGALIKNNILTLPQNNTAVLAATPVIYGIRVMGSASVQVSGNTVQRSVSNLPISTVAQKLYGISIEKSASSKVVNNTLTRMGSGIHATDVCTNSKLYCNKLDKCYNGFFLNNASIGNQGNPSGGKPALIGLTTDNVWTDLAGAVGDRVLYQIPSPSIGWYYRGNPSSYVPTSGVSYSTITPTFPINFSASSGLSGCNIQLKSPDALEREGMFGEIVRNEKSFNNHEPEFKIHEKEIAYRALKEDGWLQLGASDDPLFQNFVDSMELTNTGKFHEVRNAIEQNDFAQAESKNNSITPAHLIEENKKTVNQIYLQKASSNQMEFDATETAILESIACQDPLEGGEAVYSARVMLRKNDICQSSAKMANINNDVNEEEITPISIKEAKISAEIFPNPNDGRMQLRYSIENTDKAVLKIYNVSGKLLLNQIIIPENNFIEIANFTFGNGIYYYSVTVNDENTINKKLVVIQ